MPVVRITRRKGVSLLQPMTPAARAFVAAVNEARATNRQRRKYGNKPQIMDGRKFDSMKEAKRYVFLRDLSRNGAIIDLTCQPRFRLVVNDHHVADYYADFSYRRIFPHNIYPPEFVVEDVKGGMGRKGTRTAVYQLKRKLVRALFNIEIIEV